MVSVHLDREYKWKRTRAAFWKCKTVDWYL